MQRLTIYELSVTYRADDHALLALDQLSLELFPGRITALVGESGSGKTTLGKTVMGLLPEYAEVEGSVRLDDFEIPGAGESKLNEIRWSKVAMLFQNGSANLNPVHRVVDQVAEPLVHHRAAEKKEARMQAERALESMGLDPLLGRRFPHELSGGEIQRALLAMALILDPDVLILDEPTAALDAMTKAFVSRIILTAREQGKAILLITHDLDLARNLADDLVMLYLGQVMETMPAKDLFYFPLHPYTLALGRSYPSLETHRDLGGIRGDAFYRISHRHPQKNGVVRPHSHVVGASPSHENGHSPPKGCLFQPRCTQALAVCTEKTIPLLNKGTHQVRCLRGGIATELELEGVSKRYDDVTALGPTSLSLRAGEIFCLVGETGSGKTTLAMIAAGVLRPDRGRRVFEDRDMDRWIKEDYSSLAGRIGLIHQNPAQAVSHRFCVFDIVAEPLRIQNQGSDKEELRKRVMGALKDVHLSTETQFSARYPHELNMGALQRVCIARALVSKPSLVIADEPTSSLDPSVQAKVLKMMLDLQIEKGLTMLFITHDLGLARKIGDRIGVMLAGRLVETGPAVQVMGRPAHPYTRLLIAGTVGKVQTAVARQGRASSRGCPFVERCDQAREACSLSYPETSSLEEGLQMVQCHFPLAYSEK
ncbi:MAG: ABC transporter ATP-binding protein [Deltaproteobacteria bacterium]|nr:ABC transporter ATP-binding protein [Deltaproteobacteria bacterium]